MYLSGDSRSSPACSHACWNAGEVAGWYSLELLLGRAKVWEFVLLWEKIVNRRKLWAVGLVFCLCLCFGTGVFSQPVFAQSGYLPTVKIPPSKLPADLQAVIREAHIEPDGNAVVLPLSATVKGYWVASWNPEDCPAAGCTDIWFKAGAKYADLKGEGAVKDVHVLRDVHNGLHNIALEGSAWEGIYQFDGTHYVLSKCFYINNNGHLIPSKCPAQ